MTFLEAAIEILRHEEGPLHFSEIAKRAVDRKLLSHVGRDPEAAMRSCLTSAVRSTGDALLERTKPGHYRVRPGAQLPPSPEPPEVKEKDKDNTEVKPAPARRKRTAKKAAQGSAKKTTKKVAKKAGKKAAKSSGKSKASGEKAQVKEPASDSGEPAADAAAEAPRAQAAAPSKPTAGVASPEAGDGDGGGGGKIEFVAPEGSGLDGVTDVALVMANAMSRLADERPELREELEAMQANQAAPGGAAASGASASAASEPVIETKAARGRTEPVRRDEERSGRRRRRRRRRSKRVEWVDTSGRSTVGAERDDLLAKVERALAEAGPRSLHVRQIAEALAAEDVLGGEISEVERAVTAAILLDVHQRGRASRFSVRGDARFQLHGARVPEPAAVAEKSFRDAGLALEVETRKQLSGWLSSLGARALEALVRIHLETEGYSRIASLPPGRGLGKLVVEDADADEEDRRQLVLVVPAKTTLEPKLWEGEAERASCAGVIVFAMGDPTGAPGDVRVVGAGELADWLVKHQVGVRRLEMSVPVLDPAVIESIGGLDT